MAGQIPMGTGNTVTHWHLLGADGRSDEVTAREDEYVCVEAVRAALVPVLAASHGVFGAKRCLQEFLSSRGKVAKLPRFPQRQPELTSDLRQWRAWLGCDPRRP